MIIKRLYLILAIASMTVIGCRNNDPLPGIEGFWSIEYAGDTNSPYTPSLTIREDGTGEFVYQQKKLDFLWEYDSPILHTTTTHSWWRAEYTDPWEERSIDDSVRDFDYNTRFLYNNSVLILRRDGSNSLIFDSLNLYRDGKADFNDSKAISGTWRDTYFKKYIIVSNNTVEIIAPGVGGWIKMIGTYSYKNGYIVLTVTNYYRPEGKIDLDNLSNNEWVEDSYIPRDTQMIQFVPDGNKAFATLNFQCSTFVRQ